MGISEAELIRRNLEQETGMVRSEPWDRSRWERELRFIEERARIQQLKKMLEPAT